MALILDQSNEEREAKVSLLFVDDMTRYHSVYKGALEESIGAIVTFARNGQEALSILDESNRFDLILLDVNMPILDGETTLQKIRQNPQFDDLPIIMFTGEESEEKELKLLNLGADDFIPKGVSLDILVARINALLRYKQDLNRLTDIAVDCDLFTAGVLHDIRNLEFNIQSSCFMILESLNEPASQGLVSLLQSELGILRSQGKRLGDYASKIINMVRSTHGSMSLGILNPSLVLQWCGELIAPKTLSICVGGLDRCTVPAQSEHPQDKQIRIVLPSEDIFICADENLLRLVFINILQNTIKYNKGHKLVALELTSERVEGRKEVILRLRDYGPGVDRDQLKAIFVPFVRGKQQSKDGYGLGLALVNRVMIRMGGRVWAELPQDGVGLCICLAFQGGNP